MRRCTCDQVHIDDRLTYLKAFVWIVACCIHTLGKNGAHAHMCAYCMLQSVCACGCVCGQVNAGELFFQCHIFGMVVLCPRLLHSW